MGASACTHPLDLIKVRFQLAGELDARAVRPGAWTMLRGMVAREGIAGFYSGLSASLLRQALYSPARFGLFQTLMERRSFGLISGGTQSKPSSAEKLVASLTAGAFGGLLSSPADLVMVRMQADGRLSRGVQRAYPGVLGGFQRVVLESGWTGLWRGATPNIQRAMVTTMTQFTAYDFFKGAVGVYVPGLGQGVAQHFVASMLAGVVVASAACPMDVMRTRMMNSKKMANAAAASATTAATVTTNLATAAASTTAASAVSSAAPASAPPSAAFVYGYRSTWDCFTQTMRTEGPRGFYKGFLPYYSRVAPQVTLMFVFYEQLQNIYDEYLQ